MDSIEILKAIVIYLDRLGFDFENNSAMTLIDAITEIALASLKDPAIKENIQDIIDELNEEENYA